MAGYHLHSLMTVEGLMSTTAGFEPGWGPTARGDAIDGVHSPLNERSCLIHAVIAAVAASVPLFTVSVRLHCYRSSSSSAPYGRVGPKGLPSNETQLRLPALFPLILHVLDVPTVAPNVFRGHGTRFAVGGYLPVRPRCWHRCP